MATAVLVLSLLSPFAGAVTISYTADSGGESVSISESYDVDNTVTVKESTDIGFGNLQVDQERTAKGTGEADLKQTISGKSVDGVGYVAENDIKSESTIDARTFTSVTGDTIGMAQTVSATGDAKSALSGIQGGDSAMQKVEVRSGSLSSTQNMNIWHSVSITQTANLEGTSYVKGSATSNGNFADTETSVEGSLSSTLDTRASGVAECSQRFMAKGDSSAMAYSHDSSASSEFKVQVLDKGSEAEEMISGNLHAGAGRPQISYGDLSVQGDEQLFNWEDKGSGPIAPITQIVDLSDEEGTKKITNTVEGEVNYNIKRALLIKEDSASFNQNINCECSVEGSLGGEEGGDMAAHVAKVYNGRLNSEQTLDIGNSVHTLLDASIWSDFGVAHAVAVDADGDGAVTEVGGDG